MLTGAHWPMALILVISSASAAGSSPSNGEWVVLRGVVTAESHLSIDYTAVGYGGITIVARVNGSFIGSVVAQAGGEQTFVAVDGPLDLTWRDQGEGSLNFLELVLHPQQRWDIVVLFHGDVPEWSWSAGAAGNDWTELGRGGGVYAMYETDFHGGPAVYARSLTAVYGTLGGWMDLDIAGSAFGAYGLWDIVEEPSYEITMTDPSGVSKGCPCNIVNGAAGSYHFEARGVGGGTSGGSLMTRPVLVLADIPAFPTS